MKMPEPVAWWNGKETAWFEHELDGYKPPPDATIPLYTEAQLREALAQQEAVMRQALEALNRMERYGNTFLYRRDEQNPHEQTCEAIKALKEQLK